MPPEPVDVLVVGAGPTGLALALQAAAHGASVRVVERRPEPFRPSRALIVHPRTLEVLRPLGVTDALLDRGEVAPSVQLHLRSGVVPATLGPFDLPDTAFPHLLLVRQADVEAVLGAALAARGVPVERGVEVVGLTTLADHAVAATRHHGGAGARFVVGCDGPASVVRAAMGTTWAGGPYGQEVVLADLELEGGLEPGVVHATPGPGGLVFLFALGERATWRLLATRPVRPCPSPFGQPGPPVPPAEVQALLDASGLDAGIAEVRWSARLALQHRIAGAYRAGPVFVAGDAAHTHSPAGGQGMNTGIQDATNLGWKLALAARGGDPAEALLGSYEAERRPVARRVLALTHLIFWSEASTGAPARAARSAVSTAGPYVLPALLRRRRLLAGGVRTLGQLRVHYRRSPLSVGGTRPSATFPEPGDRLGNATVAAAGGVTTLHALTARPGVQVLLEGDARLPELAGVGTHRLGVPGTGVAAIRPDGYVGFSGDASDVDRLLGWLSLVHATTSGAAAAATM